MFVFGYLIFVLVCIRLVVICDVIGSYENKDI